MALLLAAACGKGDKAPPAGGSAASGVASGAGVAKAPSAEVLRALAVTEVSATTRVDAVSAGPLVVVTDKSIVIDGMALAAVSGGAIEAASLDAASGHIRPVKAWAESWATAARTTGALPAVSIAITPGVPSSLLVQVLASFNAAGARDFGLIVRTPDGPGAVPLHLPVAPAVPVVDGAQPLQMILSMTPARALLWSMSGLEGTLGSPKLDLTPSAGGVWLATVRDDLADIVKKRWQGKTRPATGAHESADPAPLSPEPSPSPSTYHGTTTVPSSVPPSQSLSTRSQISAAPACVRAARSSQSSAWQYRSPSSSTHPAAPPVRVKAANGAHSDTFPATSVTVPNVAVVALSGTANTSSSVALGVHPLASTDPSHAPPRIRT